MNTALLDGTLNGNDSKPLPSSTWKQQTVQQFFAAFNWDDHSAAVQALKYTATQQPYSDRPLSLTLNVQEFFAAINWDGSTIAALPSSPDLTIANAAEDDFTLDNFSDLF
jgi:limonene-1,2-epoxide hydrolase